jgi:penicillin-binding protein 1A
MQLPSNPWIARALAAIRIRPNWRSLRCLSAAFNAALFGLVTLLVLASLLPAAPHVQYPIEQTLRPAVKRPLLLIGADGRPFAKRGECVDRPVRLAELPPHFVDAVLSMEDRRFYSHIGLDPIGIIRAFLRNREAGSIREGGSTITQQLVKISFLSSARTLERKMEEALLALWLELRLSKGEILERYLSSAYFGESCFGLRAAAKHFFGKPVEALTVAESAFLVALLRSPSQLTSNVEDAHERARLVLAAMARDGRLDPARMAELQPAALSETRSDEPGGYFADWLAETLPPEYVGPQSHEPLPVYTTFDPALQQLAETAVRSVLDKQGEKRGASQAALVAMRTDGRVVAIVGGRDRSASLFNRAVQARRQPGSSFKTFVYLAGLRAGLSPSSWVDDEPISIDGWEPKNFDGRYSGGMQLSEAFARSINTAAVRLSEAVGREAVIKAAQDLGVVSPLAPNPSLALGTSEVSLLELTAAYAAIAAGAYPVKPWAVTSFGSAPAGAGRPPSDAGAWKLTEAEELRKLMATVIRSGSGRAAGLPIPAYGKTGTSQEHRDAWFIGFAGNLVVGVWVGNDDNSAMKRVTGGSLPAQIWKTFLQGAMKTDPAFERKLPQIAAFAARTAPGKRPQSVASLDELSTGERKLQPSFRYTHLPAASFAQPERAPEARAAPRARISREFEDRLGEMGWPGSR